MSILELFSYFSEPKIEKGTKAWLRMTQFTHEMRNTMLTSEVLKNHSAISRLLIILVKHATQSSFNDLI